MSDIVQKSVDTAYRHAHCILPTVNRGIRYSRPTSKQNRRRFSGAPISACLSPARVGSVIVAGWGRYLRSSQVCLLDLADRTETI